MSSVTIGIIGIFFLFLLLAMRMQIGFSMALVGFLGFAALGSIESSFAILGMEPFKIGATYSLTVIPLFILMGQFAAKAGLSQALFKAANVWLGHHRGGIAMAAVGGCAGCAVKINTPEGEAMKRVCVDGPVFDAATVAW